MRRKASAIAAVLLLLALGAYATLFASIHADVTDTARSAMARYAGDRVQALSALVECESCSLRDRNRAVWALGQLRDRRALPVILRQRTGAECDHTAGLCQREIRKAIDAIESRSIVWLGYRDLP